MLFLTNRSRIAYTLSVARPKAFDRETALAQAMQVFWRVGYEATSMQQLVDGMGISRQSLYDTFGDKHHLYIEALEHYRRSVVKTFLEPLQSSKPLHKRLELMFEQLVEESVTDKHRKGCLIVNATLERANHDDAVLGLIEDNFNTSVVRFESLFRFARDRGELKSKQSPQALAVFLVHSISGFRVLAKSTTNRVHLRSVAKTVLMVLE
jgi:TetR/AcrR family transcriptional regulator, transcriptional repressor for nem operon